jgi:hypothetical protein
MATCATLARATSLFAIQLLFLTVWGFTGIGKLVTGFPAWFPDKFGLTFVAQFPGLHATFWILAISELIGFALAVASLCAAEFLPNRHPRMLSVMLAWSLLIFVQLSFGQWLTSEFNGTAQLFAYFAGTLVALVHVNAPYHSLHLTKPQPAP